MSNITTNILLEFDDIKRELLIQQYKNEYIYLFMRQQNEMTNCENRMSELKIIIDSYNNSIKLEYGKFITTFNGIEEMLIERPWNKLFEYHKIVKIIEYSNENFEKNIRNKIRDELIELVKNKKLNKKNEIIYDKNIKKIIDIPILKFNSDNTYYIKIK